MIEPRQLAVSTHFPFRFCRFSVAMRKDSTFMPCNHCWRPTLLGAAAILLSLVSPQARAVVLTTAGFEATGVAETEFVVGAFPQQGWVYDTPQNPPPVVSTASIVTDMVPLGGGLQSLRVDRAPGSNRRWTMPVEGQPTGRHIVISWDMAVEVTHDPEALGPFFGVEAYDGEGDLALFGSFGVDGSTGEVLFQEAGSGIIVATFETVESLEWNHFDMVLDMEDREYRIYFNQTLLETIGFVDESLNPTQFTDADIATFTAAPGAASEAATGTAWFDNFVIRNSLLTGDFNGDNNVDAADYVLWRNSLGNRGLTEPADGNADGVVDHEDYLIWKAGYGLSSEGALLGPAVAVPEPATLALVLAAVGIAGLVLRRHQST